MRVEERDQQLLGEGRGGEGGGGGAGFQKSGKFAPICSVSVPASDVEMCVI